MSIIEVEALAKTFKTRERAAGITVAVCMVQLGLQRYESGNLLAMQN